MSQFKWDMPGIMADNDPIPLGEYSNLTRPRYEIVPIFEIQMKMIADLQFKRLKKRQLPRPTITQMISSLHRIILPTVPFSCFIEISTFLIEPVNFYGTNTPDKYVKLLRKLLFTHFYNRNKTQN